MKQNRKRMLQGQYAVDGYEVRAIDIINIKCHDLKHQMKVLEKTEDNRSRAVRDGKDIEAKEHIA